MQIDWFTLVAQIFNFVVLVVLLRWLLYKPIVQTMQQRQDKITAALTEAEEKQRLAEQEAAHYRRERELLETQQNELLMATRQEADALRKAMLQQAREDVDATQIAWQESLQHEHEQFLHNLRQQMGQQLHRYLRRALADLANADLEQQAIAIFLEQLRGMAAEQRAAIGQSIQQAGQPVTVHSSFVLGDLTQQQLRDAMQDLLSAPDIRFATASHLICGIELALPGQRIGWTIDSYLQLLAERVSHILEHGSEAPDESEADLDGGRAIHPAGYPAG